jgi:hypothetical protein
MRIYPPPPPPGLVLSQGKKPISKAEINSQSLKGWFLCQLTELEKSWGFWISGQFCLNTDATFLSEPDFFNK